MRVGAATTKDRITYASRFEEGKGTNPEELVGAAHAGCFSMFLSALLTNKGYTPEEINTTATVHLGAGPTINKIELDTTRKGARRIRRGVPGAGCRGQGRLPRVQGAGQRGRDCSERQACLALRHSPHGAVRDRIELYDQHESDARRSRASLSFLSIHFRALGSPTAISGLLQHVDVHRLRKRLIRRQVNSEPLS